MEYPMLSRRTVLLIAYCLLAVFCSFSQGLKIDSLQSVLLSQKDDTNKVNTLDRISVHFWRTGDYVLAKKYAEGELALSEKINFKRGRSDAYNNLGIISTLQGSYPEALKYCLSALKLQEEAGDMPGKSRTYGNIASVYYYQGNPAEALKNSFLSLKTIRMLGDTVSESYANALGNIGVIYSDSDFSKVMEFYHAALRIRERIGNKRWIAISYNDIGTAYLDHGEFDKALKLHFDALKILEGLDDKEGMILSYGNIGTIYVRQKRAREARGYFEKAFRVAREVNNMNWIKESYGSLAEADSALGDWKSSFENYKMHILYKDSLLNEENTKKTVQLQMQYEFDKKEAQARSDQDKKDAVAATETRKQNVILISVFGGLMLVLAFAGFVFRSLRVTRKQKQLIEQQKHLVEEKQKEILDSIRYAKRIQTALMPTEKYIDKTLKRLIKDGSASFEDKGSK